MTNQQYYTAVSEAANYTDRDAYISDMALSSMWGDTPDEIPQERIDVLGQIWDAAHRTIRDIAAVRGTSVRQLAMRYAIPQRTAENWAAGTAEPPVYVLLLIQQAEGMLSR